MMYLKKVQLRNGLKPSDKLEGKYNLIIEMETGTGKTYTYKELCMNYIKLVVGANIL